MVQELAAASFIVGRRRPSAPRRTATTSAGRQAYGGAADAVRASIGGLRSLLVDIYPPSLRSAGLATALHDLASGASGHGAAVVADVDGRWLRTATRGDSRRLVFRVAQEACATRPARRRQARTLRLLACAGRERPCSRSPTTGCGFDAARADRAGGGPFRLCG